jgi:hypothetical protein
VVGAVVAAVVAAALVVAVADGVVLSPVPAEAGWLTQVSLGRTSSACPVIGGSGSGSASGSAGSVVEPLLDSVVDGVTGSLVVSVVAGVDGSVVVTAGVGSVVGSSGAGVVASAVAAEVVAVVVAAVVAGVVSVGDVVAAVVSAGDVVAAVVSVGDVVAGSVVTVADADVEDADPDGHTSSALSTIGDCVSLLIRGTRPPSASNPPAAIHTPRSRGDFLCFTTISPWVGSDNDPTHGIAGQSPLPGFT